MLPKDFDRTDHKFEQMIGHILRAGVISAAVVVFAGGILYLRDYAFLQPQYHVFNRGAAYSRSLSGIVANAWHLNSYGIIQVGLLLLIATPIIRVLFSVIVFALEKDAVYVAVTIVVLAVLAYSLFGH